MPPKRETKDSTGTPADSKQAALENLPTRDEDDATKETDSRTSPDGGSANATAEQEGDDAAAKARQRQERFKALQARAVSTPTDSLWLYLFSLINYGIEIRG